MKKVQPLRLADELRAEQEIATLLERERKLLEVQVKDSSGRLSEVFVKERHLEFNFKGNQAEIKQLLIVVFTTSHKLSSGGSHSPERWKEGLEQT